MLAEFQDVVLFFFLLLCEVEIGFIAVYFLAILKNQWVIAL